MQPIACFGIEILHFGFLEGRQFLWRICFTVGFHASISNMQLVWNVSVGLHVINGI